MPAQGFVPAQVAADPRRQAARPAGAATIDVTSRIKDRMAQTFNGQF
jgi:hypothetical protein